LAFAGSGDGDARGRRALSWKRCCCVVLLSARPRGLVSGGKAQILRIGRQRGLHVFFLLWGIVSESATTRRLVDGGMFAACFAASSPCSLLRQPFRGRWCLFGNDDGVERSFVRGSGFGSRIFSTCPRCSFAGCLVALKSKLQRRKSCTFPL
jgi:hypothetical protein